MIDTISIEIDTKKYLKITDFERISVAKMVEQHNDKSMPKHQTYVLIRWPEDIEATGAYLPRVEYMDYPNPIGGGVYGRCYKYRITFSVPKLLYGNNISELTEKQFDEVVRLLHSKLVFLALPTDITENDIKQSIVRRVDFGKNIILPKSSSMRLIGEMLMKAEHERRSKYSQVQYRNGDLYRENIKERALIVYNKIAEYCSAKKELTSDIDKRIMALNKNKETQVIRLEIQVQSTQQLKRELTMLGYEDINATKLKDIFSGELSQRLLLRYWDKITKGITLDNRNLGPQHLPDLFVDIVSCNKNCGPQKIFAKLGFALLNSECGLGKIKELYADYFNAGSWSRTKLALLDNHSGHSTYGDIQRITEVLENIKPISIEEVAYGK